MNTKEQKKDNIELTSENFDNPLSKVTVEPIITENIINIPNEIPFYIGLYGSGTIWSSTMPENSIDNCIAKLANHTGIKKIIKVNLPISLD